MHWADRIAEQLIANAPEKEEFVCATGISPSGSIHIGNFRDTVTSYFVCRALRKRGKKARLLFSWDELDRLRKIPANVPNEDGSFNKYLGKPYSDAPDPFGCCESYGKHFENEYEKALRTFGIDVDCIYQSSEYRSGRYVPHILTAIEKRKEIFDILDSFRTQSGTEEQREAYYPVSIYCPICGKDDTTINTYDGNSHVAEYTCKCGYADSFCFDTNFNCKLAWRIDWPMRWMVEAVDFEPGGKDHSAPGGSFQVGKVLVEKIFNSKAPMFQGYEFIGLKGSTGKMSGSSGLNLTPETLFRIYQPEIILWLYAKTDPLKAFNFCFDEDILRQYYEFDRAYASYKDGTADERINDAIGLSVIKGREVQPVSMQQLVSFGSIVDFVPELLETIFEKIGTPYSKNEFTERLGLAKHWLTNYSPESVNRLLEAFDSEYFKALSKDERSELIELRKYLENETYSIDELQAHLYSIPAIVRGEISDSAEKKKIQAAFFKNVYRLLLGKEKGPRLYLFLFALEKEQFLSLLPSSTNS